MTQDQQEYQLKLAVMHHPSLKTTQLIQFLQSQSNEFLSQTLPQSLPQPHTQHFLANFQSLPKNASPQQYVGILIIYNTSSIQSYQYAKDSLKKLKQVTGELFIIVVEMEAGDRKINAVGQDGIGLCKREGFLYVRLSIENSDDLVNQINRSLYELIENYYYPDQEDRQTKQIKQTEDKPSLSDANNHHQTPQRQGLTTRTQHPQQYVLQYQQPNIVASKSQRANMQSLLQKASKLRQSRDLQMIQEQRNIDESIDNVKKVLNNINRHISDKMQSGWFSQLKQNLYAPIEKNSTAFAKMKLTQQFIDDDQQPTQFMKSALRSKNYLETFKKSSMQSRILQNTNSISSRSQTIEPVLKIVLALQQSKIVEFDLTENSSIEELAKKALYLLGLTETEKNLKTMEHKINKKIQSFVKETERAVKNLERRRIAQRSFLTSRKDIK